jgi:flagellar hook-basal body complex protein FliE
MVDGIGKGGGMAREAILAALKSQAKQTAEVQANIAGSPASSLEVDDAQKSESFTDQLAKGIEAVDAEINKAESLPQDMIAGKVDDFHEVAVQLKQAEISFRFAMEVRNKLIDAYREVMRMNV